MSTEILDALATLRRAKVAGPWVEARGGNDVRLHPLGGTVARIAVVCVDEKDNDGTRYTAEVEGEEIDSADERPGLWKSFTEAQAAADAALRARGYVFLVAEKDGWLAVTDPALVYDKAFGDDRTCECGHTYYRHFDSWEEMRPVGCKYCPCGTFKEKSP